MSLGRPLPAGERNGSCRPAHVGALRSPPHPAGSAGHLLPPGEKGESCAAALGISQEELALRIGADQATVSRIEAGRMNVTLETAEEIAAALGSDVAALLARPEEAGEG